MQKKNILVKKMGKKGGKFFLGHILKYPPISVVLEYILIFTIIMSFNKTTAHLVRPHPFSTLCPTPLGKSPVCNLSETDHLLHADVDD